MKQRGYFKLPTETGTIDLHFSANCWFNLQEYTGMTISEFGKALEAEYAKDSQNTLKILDMLTDLAYAAAKANSQERNEDVTYNRFNIRTWMANLDGNRAAEFIAAMQYANHIPHKEGK